jgi:hypothetical protein
VRDLVNAYVAWDRWARQLRRERFPSGRTGEKVTHRLCDELRVHADRLGVSSTELRLRILSGIGGGLDVGAAVALAVTPQE